MGGAWQDVQSVHTSLMWCLYPLTLGWSGVSLFFVISGFCIHYSFLKHEVGSPAKPFRNNFSGKDSGGYIRHISQLWWSFII
jgi:hypothetical protein